MIDRGKRNILGILMNAVDYETAVDFVIRAARERRGAAVSTLTVHGLMTEASARQHKYRLNHFDLLVPDGHPVRWAMDDWFNLIPLAATLYIGYSIIGIRKTFGHIGYVASYLSDDPSVLKPMGRVLFSPWFRSCLLILVLPGAGEFVLRCRSYHRELLYERHGDLLFTSLTNQEYVEKISLPRQ